MCHADVGDDCELFDQFHPLYLSKTSLARPRSRLSSAPPPSECGPARNCAVPLKKVLRHTIYANGQSAREHTTELTHHWATIANAEWRSAGGGDLQQRPLHTAQSSREDGRDSAGPASVDPDPALTRDEPSSEPRTHDSPRRI
jgi:hypothetical protein